MVKIPSGEKRPIFVEKSLWKGTPFIAEVYDSQDFKGLSPVIQVQAVCFVGKNKAVLFEHVDGYFSLPGGHIKENESFKEALAREILEESACKLLDFGPLCYFRIYKESSPEKISYNLRFWAGVKPLNNPVSDPDGKAVRRVIIPVSDVARKLDWGRRGRILMKLAVKNYEVSLKNRKS